MRCGGSGDPMRPARDLRILISMQCDACAGSRVMRLPAWLQYWPVSGAVRCPRCEGEGRVLRELDLPELAGLVGLLIGTKGRRDG